MGEIFFELILISVMVCFFFIFIVMWISWDVLKKMGINKSYVPDILVVYKQLKAHAKKEPDGVTSALASTIRILTYVIIILFLMFISLLFM